MLKPKLKLLIAGATTLVALATASGQTRILPLGDSITSGLAPNSSYRYWLWHDLIDGGFNVDFVGTQSGVDAGTPANTDFDMDHEGHAGWTTQDALDNIDSIAAATQPDVVLLDLGDNDLEQGIPFPTIRTNLENIIEHLRAANPNVVVLLAEPTPYRGPGQNRVAMLQLVTIRVAQIENRKDSRVIPVNLVAGFVPRRDTDDGVHPNQIGEQLVAKRFFAMLKRVLS